MRKSILGILTSLLLFVLSGCGSTSTSGTSDSGSLINTENYQLIAVPDVVDITAPGESKTLKLYLNDIVALKPVEGIVISAQVFDQNNGTLLSYTATTDSNGYVGFEYTAPELILPDTPLVIIFEVENGVPTLEKNITINFEGSVPPDLNTSDYALIAVPDSVDIGAAGESKVLNLYLNNTATLEPVVGRVIKARIFDQNNGVLVSYEITTDAIGHVAFDYTAPNTLPESAFSITFEVKGGTPELTEDIMINFEGSVPPDLNTSDYDLIAVPDSVDIGAAGESKLLNLYLNNTATLAPVVGIVIKARIFDQNNGVLASYEITTDAIGHVAFDYTAPNTLPESAFSITFEVKGGTPELTEDIMINFEGSVPPDLNTTNYELIAVPEAVDITAPGASRALDLYLNDTALHQPVEGRLIRAQVFNQNNGTLESYDVVTDSIGHVIFNYTAPNVLPSTPLVITFEVAGGTPALTEEVTVHFISSGSDVNTTNYELYAAPDEINIQTEGSSRALDLYLGDTVTHQPVENIDIIAHFFDPNNGTLNQYTATTDGNGHVVFNYTAPETLPTGSINITFEVLNGDPVLDTNVTVNFVSPPSTDYSTYTFAVVPSDVNITAGGESRVIEAFVGNNGQPVAGESVLVDFTLDTQGRMNSFSGVTDANGHVAFNYTAPDEIVTGTNITVTLRMENNTSKEGSTIVHFSAPSGMDYSAYSFTVVPSEVNITTGGAVRVIEAFVGSNSQPVAGEPVLVDFTLDTQGRMDSFRGVTDVNGHVAFKYTAPDEIVTGTDITVTLRMENNTSKEGSSTVNFLAEPVDFDYNLTRETTPIAISTPNQVEEISVYLVNTDTWVGVEGKTITLSTPALGDITFSTAVTNVAGKATFSYQAPEVLGSPTSTSATLYFSEDGETIEKTVTIDINPSTQVSDYNLTMVTQSIDVDTARERQDVVVLLTKNGGDIATGETVYASSIPPAYGYIQNASAVTDSAGHATFTHVAADPLTNGIQPLELYHEDSNGIRVNDDVNISVTAAPPPPPDYLLGVKTPVHTITTANQIEPISVYLLDMITGVGIAGKTIQISTPFFGDVTSAAAVTDAAGKATFTHQAPDDLAGWDGHSETVNFIYPEDPSVIPASTDIEVDVATQVSDYNLTNQTTPVLVQYASEQKEIRVQLLVNGTDIAVGETVYASYLSSAFGYITNASAVTDASGYAAFNYIAADPLTDGDQELELYHEDSNGVRINAIVDINVTEASVPLDYNLTNETTPIIVTIPNQEEEISVYVVDQNHVGVAGMTVSISTIENGYGSVAAAYATTDAAGKATFDYTAPEDLTPVDGNSTSVILSLTENGVIISRTVSVQIASVVPASLYELRNARTPITITAADQIETIDIQLVHNGLPVIDARPCTTDNTVTVDCVIPESIPREYGRITDATGDPLFDGYIYFDYEAASLEDIVDVNDTNHTFNIYYIDNDGKVAADGNVTLEIRLP